MATIRLAKTEDSEVLAAIRQRAWDSAYRGIYPDKLIDEFDYNAHAVRFQQQIKQENVWVYAVQSGDSPVGFFVIGTANPSSYKEFNVCLHSLYLLPEYQGKGIGRAAMEFIGDWCREKNYTQFYNSCNPHNQKAMAFYKAMGGVIGFRDIRNDHPAKDQVYFEYRVE